MSAETLAAGAVCWRLIDGKLKVLLVHRAYRNDVSLPKGKVDPGETVPMTAVREVAEETGLELVLGAPLAVTQYLLPSGKQKTVHYWSSEVSQEALLNSTFKANGEIGALQWVTLGRARKLLSYPDDATLLEAFSARTEERISRTFPVIILRHAKALPPGSWDGPDATRPLQHRGLEQAEAIVPTLRCWGVEQLISSDAARCLATLAPLAAATGLTVQRKHGLSQDAQAEGRTKAPAVVKRLLKQREAVVLCSHGPVIPELIRELGEQVEGTVPASLRNEAPLDVGEFLVVHISRSRDRVVAVERYGPDSVH